MPAPRATATTERKAGQLLRDMEKAKRGPDKDGSGQRSQRTTSASKYAIRRVFDPWRAASGDRAEADRLWREWARLHGL